MSTLPEFIASYYREQGWNKDKEGPMEAEEHFRAVLNEYGRVYGTAELGKAQAASMLGGLFSSAQRIVQPETGNPTEPALYLPGLVGKPTIGGRVLQPGEKLQQGIEVGAGGAAATDIASILPFGLIARAASAAASGARGAGLTEDVVKAAKAWNSASAAERASLGVASDIAAKPWEQLTKEELVAVGDSLRNPRIPASQAAANIATEKTADIAQAQKVLDELQADTPVRKVILESGAGEDGLKAAIEKAQSNLDELKATPELVKAETPVTETPKTKEIAPIEAGKSAKVTKATQYSIDKVAQALKNIEELAPKEIIRESATRRKQLASAYESLDLHASKLGIIRPKLGTYYHPEEYLANARQMSAKIQETYKVTPPVSIPSPSAEIPKPVQKPVESALVASSKGITENPKGGIANGEVQGQKAQEVSKGISFKEVDAPTFKQAISATTNRPQYLSDNPVEDLAKSRLFLSDDGRVGYALSPDGYLGNIFNNGGPRGAGKEALIQALTDGAKTGDCFDGFLTQLYTDAGFKEVKRVPWDDQYAPKGWNYLTDGRPDVVYLEYDGTRDAKRIRETLETNRGQRNRVAEGTGAYAPVREETPGGTRPRVDTAESGATPQGVGLRSEPVTPQSATAPPPVPPAGGVTVPAGKDPKQTFRNWLNKPQRASESKQQADLFNAERVRRLQDKFAPRYDALVAKGVPVKDAIEQATKELAGELPRIKTSIGDVIPDDARNALYQVIVDKYGPKDFRTLSASEALTNALAGKPIPNVPGAKGGSALKLLRDTFEDMPEVIDMINNPDDFLDKLKGPGDFNFKLGIPDPNQLRLEAQVAETVPKLESKSFALPQPTEAIPANATAKLRIALSDNPARAQFMSDLKVIRDNALDAANIPRAFITSYDISAAGRQGIILSASHPMEAARAFKSQIKALMKEENAVALEKEILSRPFTRKSSLKGDLYIAKRGAPMNQREETWASKFAEKIPGVRASERAYLTYLNDLRSRVYEKGAQSLNMMNASPGEYKALAEFINWATGRGSIPKNLADYAPVMNATLFSPRLLMSRVELPAKLLSSSAYTRKEAWRAFGAMLAFGGSAVGLGAIMSGKAPELDPRSADFGKVRIGDTRLDFWGGYTQYLRFAAQMLSGQTKTVSGSMRNINTFDTLQRFAQSKESPVVGFLHDMLSGTTYMGEAMTTDAEDVRKQLYGRLTPLVFQDLIDAINQEGFGTGIAMGATSALGFGVVTYTDPLVKARNEAARKAYGMSYDDVGRNINKVAQMAIDKSSPDIQKYQQEQDAAYAKTSSGKTDVRNLYYQQTKAAETEYNNTVTKAVQEFRDTGDGAAFRDKVNQAARSRTSNYDVLKGTSAYKEITDELDQPLPPDKAAKMNPVDVARIAYGKMLYGGDMYDGYGNYRFDLVDAKRKQFATQFGQAALDYNDLYRGVKETELPPEYAALKSDQKTMRPYWDIMQNFPTEEQTDRKLAFRLGDPATDAALNLWGYTSVASTPQALELLRQKAQQLGLDPMKIKALAPDKADPIRMWNSALSFVPAYYRTYMWDKGGFRLPGLRNVADAIITARLKDQPLIDQYIAMERSTVDSGKVDRFRIEHPDIDAALNIWGHSDTVNSAKAMTLLKAKAQELGIPYEALPISPQYQQRKARETANVMRAERQTTTGGGSLPSSGTGSLLDMIRTLKAR
jgi:hypothetical protein